jgi:uncharacterized protein (DUF58 family)
MSMTDGEIRRLKDSVADTRLMVKGLHREFKILALAVEALERRSYKAGPATIVVRNAEGLTDDEALYGVRADV